MTQDPNDKKYDLEERTAKFGENSLIFLRKIKQDAITSPLITQYTKCSTSVGANYCEADDSESKIDFKHKIGICKKESRECKHFLRMLTVTTPELKDDIRKLWQEAKELNLIFNKIYKSVKK